VFLIHGGRIFDSLQWTTQQPLNKYRWTGSVVDIRRRQRLSITSRGQYWYIAVLHLRNRFHTAATTTRVNVLKHNFAISSQTNRNLLKEVAVWARRPRKVFKMSDRHRAARMALDDVTFCSHRHCCVCQWKFKVFARQRQTLTDVSQTRGYNCQMIFGWSRPVPVWFVMIWAYSAVLRSIGI